jgi:hypothetical protein
LRSFVNKHAVKPRDEKHEENKAVVWSSAGETFLSPVDETIFTLAASEGIGKDERKSKSREVRREKIDKRRKHAKEKTIGDIQRVNLSWLTIGCATGDGLNRIGRRFLQSNIETGATCFSTITRAQTEARQTAESIQVVIISANEGVRIGRDEGTLTRYTIGAIVAKSVRSTQ